MRFSSLMAGAAALGLVITPASASAQAQAAAPAKPAGSLYLQCDGQPNNMTDGEMAARLLGAVTLLGLFAKPPESADASKRQFGAAGVAACTSLIEGERREGNPNRRIGLILGRAIHQIEAKKPEAALQDVALARREAEAAGLTKDPYWMASRGRSFDQVEAAALFRLDKPAEAQEASLRGVEAQQYSLLGLIDLASYDDYVERPSAAEDRRLAFLTRLAWPMGNHRADRLEQAGRFAEAARLRDAIVEYDATHTPEFNDSSLLAEAAVSHALAGNAEVAAERAKAAKANSEARKAAGKPENDAAEIVELLDLHAVLDLASKGDLKTARRLFSARSEWIAPSFGAVAEVNRRLRAGASADELIGGLAKTPEQLWAERRDAKKAALLAKDGDNKALFGNMAPALTPRPFTDLSRNVWNVEKSRIILKRKPTDTSKFDLMFLYGTHPDVALQAYLLHAALTAKSRGHQGFVFNPLITSQFIAGTFRSGNMGEKGFAPDLFIAADPVIAALRQFFPDPETLKARSRS